MKQIRKYKNVKFYVVHDENNISKKWYIYCDIDGKQVSFRTLKECKESISNERFRTPKKNYEEIEE